MKNTVLFVLLDPDVEARYAATSDGWTQLRGILHSSALQLTEVHAFCWNGERRAALEILRGLRCERPDIRFTCSMLPFHNSAEVMASREYLEATTEYIYNQIIHFKFDFQANDYYLFAQGVHGFLRAFFYYFSTMQMIDVSLLEILPPGPRVPWPGLVVINKVDMRVYERLSRIIRERRYDSYNFLKAGIPTRNQAFNTIIERIEYVASRSRDPMLLLGPTGAGKSVLAKRIYQLKAMKKNLSGPFVDVSCSAIRGDSAQSLLFGHVKGAFTGALQSRDGLLKTAHKGLLFLDEIGVLGLEEQALLLKAIEEKRFFPVGSDREVSSDFQLICGTNLDLGEEVRAGRFRSDLYARINLWTFRLPALAQRPEDIEPNLEFELNRIKAQTSEHVLFAPDARRLFLDFAVSAEARWLGNFRDFSAAVRRMALLADTGVIGCEHVHDEVHRLLRLWTEEEPQPVIPAGKHPLARRLLGPRYHNFFDLIELAQLEEVLETARNSPSLSEAGRTLFAVSRSRRSSTNDADRLRKFLHRFGLEWSEVKEKVSDFSRACPK